MNKGPKIISGYAAGLIADQATLLMDADGFRLYQLATGPYRLGVWVNVTSQMVVFDTDTLCNLGAAAIMDANRVACATKAPARPHLVK